MRIRTVRQVKQQQKQPRNKPNVVQASNDSNASSGAYQPNPLPQPPPPAKPISPPYRMPPQPPGASPISYESPIPGAASNELPLRMHSAKFPIERESNLTAATDTSKGTAAKIPLMPNKPRTPSGPRRTSGIPLLPRTSGSIAPDHPTKQMQAWNSHQHTAVQIESAQSLQSMQLASNALMTGAIPRTPARLPEDVTALATDSSKDRDPTNKNAVTKTYHTLKDLISGKFKRDPSLEASTDELNNSAHYQPQHQQQQQTLSDSSEPQQPATAAVADDDYRSPYSALPMHMRQNHTLQSQPNIWNGKQPPPTQPSGPASGSPRSYGPPDLPRGVQQRAISQPQLNMPPFDRRDAQLHPSHMDRRGSLAHIDVTDSDDGGFAVRRTPQHLHQMQAASSQSMPQRNSPQSFQQMNAYASQQQQQQQQQHQQQYSPSPYQPHFHNSNAYNSSFAHQLQQQQQQQQLHTPGEPNGINTSQLNGMYSASGHTQLMSDTSGLDAQLLHQSRQDALRASFQKSNLPPQNQPNSYQIQSNSQQQPSLHAQRNELMRMPQQPNQPPDQHPPKPIPGSAGSSDYDKSGNHSSNVDSGRGSAAYSSGRKANLDADTSEVAKRLSMVNHNNNNSSSNGNANGNDDSEWVDIVDAELRHILVPNMQGLMIRPSSTVSGSVSSMSPPLPPLSPGGSSYKQVKTKDKSKQEYGTDSYNRPGRASGAIGPSRAGWPGASVQKQLGNGRTPTKKQDQAMLKRHLFGLDNDMTSTTTRSLDLESILGAPWGTGQSVSDSETDTQGIRHIRSQLEGLENMYGEVMKMLGSRGGGPTLGRMHEGPLRGGAAARRRHGSLSSLPSSSVSGRPIRDRRRSDDRRKVRDIKGINKRFQRLESHVVTLARSVAHLSSEMRSQHQVTQELERLRDDLTALRSQSMRTQHLNHNTTNGNDPEPPNLTNPRRVKKLTKFFGEDPPLMRLFLKNLGYEKYANLFEAERVGMIELPYLGEERLQKLGVPLGPRLRILQEAQISLCKDTTLCIV